MATGPGQVWSWDITRLLGPRKWSYFYLYVIMSTSSAATSWDELPMLRGALMSCRQ